MRHDPQGARRVLADIFSTIDLIAEMPSSGRALKRRMARVRYTPRYRYRIVFEGDGSAVRLPQVIHPRRDAP